MESYLVRIYQRRKERTTDIAGTVQCIGTEGVEVFQSAQDLVELLAGEQKEKGTDSSRQIRTGTKGGEC
ncbi:MAG: hypothetical protein M0042_09025 [Nitrospiraceae bacterium]|nr:hypothetical protein [Nitrospiraceae bacterium]